jgi:hypothetical protein
VVELDGLAGGEHQRTRHEHDGGDGQPDLAEPGPRRWSRSRVSTIAMGTQILQTASRVSVP